MDRPIVSLTGRKAVNGYDFRTRQGFHPRIEQRHRLFVFFRRQAGSIKQSVPIISQVFQTLNSIKTNRPSLADIDQIIAFPHGDFRNFRRGIRFPSTWPTIAAISGDMPSNRVGINLALSVLITIPSPPPSRRVFYPYPR